VTSASNSTEYVAEQQITDSSGNPMPAATIAQRVSARFITSAPQYGGNYPALTSAFGAYAEESTYIADGLVMVACGSQCTATTMGTSACPQVLITLRPE
jgi:hypothetical protein